jgi:hypothetical protein
MEITHNAFAALVFCLAAGAGQFVHGLKKWAKDETVDSLGEWFFADRKATILALLSNAGGMVVYISMVDVTRIATSVGWWPLILLGFTSGYTVDSALNKATRETA